MKKNKKAETMIGVLISVVILSAILLGIISIVSIQKNNNKYFENEFKIRIIEKNLENILKNLKLDTINAGYFYINNNGNNISLSQDENHKQKDFGLKNIGTNTNEKYEIKIIKFDTLEGQKTYGEIIINKI